jgi:hypothetical protein
MTLTSTSST